ncbi:hypothetical protein [Cyanobium sp. NIES-981]|uniref:hypothetical protein n=1 Tax=Cyanobium sp. NIES-981 TaxID=1851505 RepID=UPI0007DCF75F|nr:hypothetical protein [Cyanobium sp. NIES-981]SBO43872.1 conserved protein of unknown function [Cyanobium sp. NIES-981]
MEPADLTATEQTATQRTASELTTTEHSTEALITRHLSVQQVSDLALYEQHSAIIQRLCDALGFEQPATAMAWVFDQLEQSKDLQKAIFDLLND